MATKKPKTVGAAIDDLWALREEKRAAEAVVKEVEVKIAAAESVVYEAMDAQGVLKSTGSKATVSIGTTESFQIEDYDSLVKYIKKSGHFHLLQRRISVEAARELYESKGAVPGLQPFSKRKLNILTLK